MEVEYSEHLDEGVYGFGNVHHEVEKMTFLINWLSPSIESIVTGFRETQPRRY